MWKENPGSRAVQEGGTEHHPSLSINSLQKQPSEMQIWNAGIRCDKTQPGGFHANCLRALGSKPTVVVQWHKESTQVLAKNKSQEAY